MDTHFRNTNILWYKEVINIQSQNLSCCDKFWYAQMKKRETSFNVVLFYKEEVFETLKHYKMSSDTLNQLTFIW